MNGDEVFRSPKEELEKLLEELTRISADLREIGTRVSQIDRHVRRAFIVPKAPTNAGKDTVSRGSESAPTLSRESALALFEELTNLARGHGLAAVEGRLGGLGLPDLKLLAHELGISFNSKPSRKKLLGGVVSRVTESLMLSRNINVRGPRAGEAPPVVVDRRRDEDPKE